MFASVSAVEFGDGSEPMAVGRHKVRTWLHCLVREAGELPDGQRTELQSWLETRGCDPLVPSVLVTRDDQGVYRVHAAGLRLEVALSDLPVWMRRPEPPAPEPKPAAAKTAKAVR